MKNKKTRHGLSGQRCTVYCLLLIAIVMLLLGPSIQQFLASTTVLHHREKQGILTTQNSTPSSCFDMPIPDLLDAITSNSEEAELWGAAAITWRNSEAMPYIKTMLQEGTPQEQYNLAHTLKNAYPAHYERELLQIVTSPETHQQAKIGALYALSQVSLKQNAQKALATIAHKTKSPMLRRTALIALQHSSLSAIQKSLAVFLEHEDPITRIYAARLLLGTTHQQSPTPFISLATHENYLVRQETYDLLGEYNDSSTTTCLYTAAKEEPNQSAARSARLALKKQELRQLQGAKHTEASLSLLFNTEDLEECWLGIQFALRYNKPLGVAALKQLAASDSVLRESAVARLITVDASEIIPTKDRKLPQNKHFLSIHNSMTQYNVQLHNSLPTMPEITRDMERLFTGGVFSADIGLKPLNHAWNPLTGRGFLRRHGFGGSAQEYASELRHGLDTLCSNSPLTAEAQLQAWELAGNLFHLLQDMTSPLHVFCVWHVFNGHFETYWMPFTEETVAAVDSWNIQPSSLPSLPRAAIHQMDNCSRTALERRIANLPDSLEAYQEALAWCTYYRASFWGEIRYEKEASPTQTIGATFDDNIIESQPNTLGMMFNHNIRYHTSWLKDYFEITDRKGNTFSWNRIFALDDWRPCPNPRNRQVTDGHTVVLDAIPRITGRFYFTHKWKRTPYCFPFTYPDGTAMTEHIVQYFGKSLFPVTAAYCGGWLLALAKDYPAMFSSTAPSQNNKRISALQDRLNTLWQDIQADSSNSSETLRTSPSDLTEYMQIYFPRCGCIPR